MVKNERETSSDLKSDPVTAVDYLESQFQLEREAKELMPYDPNTCTYVLGGLRQQVFACLTCSKLNGDKLSGVCYSCSIQCHSTHELVELFTKRNFTCDCGTTRMSRSGGCKIRCKPPGRRDSISSSSSIDLTPTIGDDIPSSSNLYNDNFKGLFCSCKQPYDPLKETGNMIQCHFGYVCGEEWFHDECIMGYKPGSMERKRLGDNKRIVKLEGVNLLDDLTPAGLDAHSDNVAKQEDDEDEDVDPLPGFPDLDDFDTFICWKCIDMYKEQFSKFGDDIIFTKLAHIDCESSEERETKLNGRESEKEDGPSKRRKVELKYSYFFKEDASEQIKKLKESTSDKTLIDFLDKFSFLYEEDPIYEPDSDQDDDDGSSIFDLGTRALNSLPREKAIEGLHAYEHIKERLRGFLKPFAEEGKVVTEGEIRDFFAKVQEEKDNIQNF